MIRILILLITSFVIGSLPFTIWIFRSITQKDLRQLGTGNLGVSAAFIHGGTKAGIPIVLLEVFRGILPVGLALGMNLDPIWALIGLWGAVVARYFQSGGAGVTNATWGILAYSPPLAGLAALTGGTVWILSRSRQWGIRGGCASAVLWSLFLHYTSRETLVMLGLASFLLSVNIRQADDMALLTRSVLIRLQDALDPRRCGEKASRLALLQQAGFPVPDGWVLPVGVRFTGDPPPLTDPWIVRSSATTEDSDTMSAAGIYRTIANITSLSALQEAIQTCRDSVNTESALAYQDPTSPESVDMAVLVQSYIQGQVSGVAFSRNPLDGSERIILEALPGGAEDVVSGQKTPIHLEIPYKNLSELPKEIWQDLNPLLPEEVLQKLLHLIQDIEKFFHGIPQDIEWTWDGDTLWILQSRPITHLRPIWTRTIAAEVIPGAIVPLTWSINRPLTCGVWGSIFTLVLGEKVKDLDFTQTATLLGSHAYFNATLLGEIFRQMGLPEQGLEFLVRGQKMGKPPRSAYQQLFKCLPGLWRLIQREVSLAKDFDRDNHEHFQPILNTLQNHSLNTLTNSELIALVDQILEALTQVTFYNIVGPIGLALRRLLFQVPDTWIRDDASPENKSLAALQQLALNLRQEETSEDPKTLKESLQQALKRPEFRSQFNEFLSTYGFLSEVGTNIAIPCWREYPDTISDLLINLALTPPPPPPPTPKLTLWEQWRASQCQQRLTLKGQIATVYAHLLAYLRWTFLVIEQRWIQKGILEEEGDIFFLGLEEIKEWIQSRSQPQSSSEAELKSILKEKIQIRRLQWQEDQQRQIPSVVYGSFLPSAYPVELPNTNLTRLTGIPASRGIGEGTVKIYRSLGERISLEPDTILVLPYTDAGWAPLLVGAKAIIAEVGGQLSHGAILAREYGIPAVMNVPNATHLLRDGQRVKVDGYLGIVEIEPIESDSQSLDPNSIP